MEKVNDPVTFAVVGCGHIGRRHAAVVAAHPGARLGACCDLRPRAELGWPAQLADTPWYASLDDLLAAEPAVEVVNICTPNGLHASQAIAALRAGRHVVIEKPMALRRTDCEAILHTALTVSRQVFCVMQNRYSPAAAWLKKTVADQRLGDIHLVQLTCLWNRDGRYYHLPDGSPHPWHGHPELDGGVLFTQFAHFVDLLYWIFGDIAAVRSTLARRGGFTPFPDTGVVQFELQGGGVGSLQFSTAVWDRNFESSITVTGSRGSVRLGGQYMNEITYCHGQDLPMPQLPASPPANQYGGYQGSAANHEHVIQNVLDVLRGGGAATTNALEGMKVVDLIERMMAGG